MKNLKKLLDGKENQDSVKGYSIDIYNKYNIHLPE